MLKPPSLVAILGQSRRKTKLLALRHFRILKIYSLKIVEQNGILADYVAWVVWEVITTVIKNSLQSPYTAKEGRLPIVEASNPQAHRKSQNIDRYRLKRMVVKSTVRKGNMYLMM